MDIVPFKQNFLGGVNLDDNELRIKQIQAALIKNMTANVNANPNTPAGAGSNLGVFTPLEGNLALTVSLPSGANYCIGFYSSEQTNEGYAFIYNSLSSHTILVIRGDLGTVDIVYEGARLGFVLDPAYFISEGRCTLELKSYTNPVSLTETDFKFLIFTFDKGIQYFISVEDSISTNSFVTPVPYFAGAGTFYDPITLIHLGVPTPLSCIGFTPVTPTLDDLEKQNLLIRNGWQFRVKFIDVFGRESEHGLISSQYITIVGGGCISASNGMPRCIMLSFDAGNPLVNQIQIEFRKWVSDDILSGWQKTDVIDKWIDAPGQMWYQRSANTTYFDTGTNKISYKFCADGNCEPVDAKETARTQPGLPISSATVFSINKRIGLGGNVRGFDAPNQAEVDKISFEPEIPSSTTCPPAPMRRIEVYASIFAPFPNETGIVRESYGKVVWGNADAPCGASGTFSADQVFGDQANPGFLGYMAGMSGGSYACVSEQGDLDFSTGTFTHTGYTGITPTANKVQKFSLTVPAGKYMFRLGSHHAKITDSDFQKTSTRLAGLCRYPINLTGGMGDPTSRYGFAREPVKEIEIDCTAGDVIINGFSGLYAGGDPFLIILDAGGAGIDGYLYEQEGGAPVEMNPILFGSTTGAGSPGDAFGSFFSDHNGYYFMGTSFDYAFVKIFADLCDGSGAMERLFINPFHHGMWHGDGTNTPTGACTGVKGAWKNKMYVAASFPNCARRIYEQRIGLCDEHSAGVPGIVAVATKSAVAVTDVNGKARLVLHNRYNYSSAYSGAILPPFAADVPDYSSDPDRNDRLIFSQKGGCQWTACGGCDPFVPDVALAYTVCCTPCATCRFITLTEFFVVVFGVNIKGVRSGGRYPCGVIFVDKIGRHTFVQTPSGDAQFVDIPNLNDATYRQFNLCKIKITIDPTAVFPEEFVKIIPVVADNTRFSDFISIPADWVQFVNNTGATDTTNPTQIRIYYGSLNEYNKQNNNTTNCKWQFMSGGTDGESPKSGDIVQFIMNGNGAWFDGVVSAPITYDRAGLFFTIEYSNDLVSLINGALFRIIRPKTCQTNYIYYQQCLTIDLVDGVPQLLTGTLTYTDSYMLSRLMPVPILKGQPGPIPPGGTPPVTPIATTSTNGDTTIDSYADFNKYSNNVVEMSIVDAQTAYPFLFESPSASDLWGDHIVSKGLPVVANPYEARRRIDMEVALSDSLSDRGNLNYLNYFRGENAVVFDRNTWGGIVSILVETSIMLVICTKDHFLVRYGGGQVNVDKDNNLISDNQYGVFGAPQRKSGSNYGCSSEDINTIRRYSGRVCWLDRSGYVVFHDFSVAKAVQFNGYDGYINNKISELNRLNSDPSINGLNFFTAGIDVKTWEYYLSTFRFPVSGSASYVNNLSDVNLAVNETIIIDLETGTLKGMASFTPEYFGHMSGYFLQKNFITFKNGVPYIHHHGVNVGSVPYNNFYGVQCKKWVVLVVNPGSEKVKRYLYNEVYCKQHMFYVPKVLTEKGQLSRILPGQWDKRENFWCAAYLCDLNTPADPNLPLQTGAHKILDGNPLGGRWMKVYYCSEDDNDGDYCELSAIVNYIFGVEDTAV